MISYHALAGPMLTLAALALGSSCSGGRSGREELKLLSRRA
jgi:hypothetical protein